MVKAHFGSGASNTLLRRRARPRRWEPGSGRLADLTPPQRWHRATRAERDDRAAARPGKGGDRIAAAHRRAPLLRRHFEGYRAMAAQRSGIGQNALLLYRSRTTPSNGSHGRRDCARACPFRRHAGYLFAGGDDLAVARYVRLLGQRTRAMSSRGPPGEHRRPALQPAPQRGDGLEGLHGFRRTADLFPGRETLARCARHSRSPVHRHDHRVKRRRPRQAGPQRAGQRQPDRR